MVYQLMFFRVACSSIHYSRFSQYITSFPAKQAQPWQTNEITNLIPLNSVVLMMVHYFQDCSVSGLCPHLLFKIQHNTFHKLDSIVRLWALSLRPNSVPVFPSFGLRAETDPVIDTSSFFLNINNGPVQK